MEALAEQQQHGGQYMPLSLLAHSSGDGVAPQSGGMVAEAAAAVSTAAAQNLSWHGVAAPPPFGGINSLASADDRLSSAAYASQEVEFPAQSAEEDVDFGEGLTQRHQLVEESLQQ